MSNYKFHSLLKTKIKLTLWGVFLLFFNFSDTVLKHLLQNKGIHWSLCPVSFSMHLFRLSQNWPRETPGRTCTLIHRNAWNQGLFFFYSWWSFQGLRFFTMPLAIITHSCLHKWPTQYTLHLASMQFSSSCDRLSLSPEPSFNYRKVKHYFKLQYTRVVLFVSSVKFQVLSVPYESKLLHVRNFPSILCLKHEIVYLYSCPFAKLFKSNYIKNKKLLQSVNLCLQNSVNIEMLELIFKKRS